MTDVHEAADPAKRKGLLVRLTVAPAVLAAVCGLLWWHHASGTSLPTDVEQAPTIDCEGSSLSALPATDELTTIGGYFDLSGNSFTDLEGLASVTHWAGTPDLRERFIRGTAEHASLNTSGGTPAHDHGGLTGRMDTAHSDWWWRANTDIKRKSLTDILHQHPLESAPHLPPYTMLIYIMKV